MRIKKQFILLAMIWSLNIAAGQTSVISAIKSLVIPSTNPETYGLWSDTQSGLGHKIWKKSNRATVEELLQTPWPSLMSPTLYNLALRLLLASTEVPAPNGSSGNLLNLRAQKLFDLGEIEYAFDLIKGSSARVDPGLFQKLKFCVLIDQQKQEEALKLALVEAPKTKDVFWQEAIIFCQLLSPAKQESARLALSLYQDDPKIADPEFVFLAEHILSKKKKSVPVSSTHSLMKILMRLHIGLLPDPLIQITPPGYLKIIRAHPQFNALPVATRLRIQERILTYHQTSDWVEALRTAYTEAVTKVAMPCPFDPKADPLGGAPILLEDDPMVRAHLYHLFVATKEPAKKMNYAALLMQNALHHDLYLLIAPLVAPGLKDMPIIDPAIAPYLAWVKALNAGVKINAEMTRLEDPVVLVGLVLQDPEGGWGEVLAQNQKLEALPYKHILLSILYPWYKILAQKLALGIWKHQLEINPDLQKSPFLLNLLLQDAQARKQKGEVIVLTLLLSAYEDFTNSMIKSVGSLPSMLQALHKVGLEKEAAALAMEKLATLMEMPHLSLSNPPAPPPAPKPAVMPLTMFSKIVTPVKTTSISNVSAAT